MILALPAHFWTYLSLILPVTFSSSTRNSGETRKRCLYVIAFVHIVIHFIRRPGKPSSRLYRLKTSIECCSRNHTMQLCLGPTHNAIIRHDLSHKCSRKVSLNEDSLCSDNKCRPRTTTKRLRFELLCRQGHYLTGRGSVLSVSVSELAIIAWNTINRNHYSNHAWEARPPNCYYIRLRIE